MRASTGFSSNSFAALDVDDELNLQPAPRLAPVKSEAGLGEKRGKQKTRASTQQLPNKASRMALPAANRLGSTSKASRLQVAHEPYGPEEEPQQKQNNVLMNGGKVSGKQGRAERKASPSARPANGHVVYHPQQQQQQSHMQAANLRHNKQETAAGTTTPKERKPWKRKAARSALYWTIVMVGLPALVGLLVQQEHIKVHHTDMNLSSFNVTVPLPTVEVPALANITADLTDFQASVAAKVTALYASMSLGNMSLNLQPASLLTEWLPSIHMDSLNMSVSEALDKVFAQLPSFSSTTEGGSTAPAPVRPGQVLAQRGLKAKYPVVIVPGFITSQLELWEGQECAKRYFRQRMWGTMTMMQIMLRDSSCWMHHIGLDLATGLDPPGVKLRAAQGLEAVDFFVQGYWVWGKLVESLADVGYDTNNLVTMAYDWRLAIPLMEARDAWFTRAKSTVEMQLAVTGQPAVLVSHSYGENVARTFLHWAESHTPGWVERHVHAHVAIAGPTLGVPKALTSMLSGETYDTAQLGGLAAFLTDRMLPRTTRARLFRSWASMLAMLPVGGPKVWGNATWAPDDTPSLQVNNRSYGSFIVSAPLKSKPARPDGAAPSTADLQPSQFASPSPLLPPSDGSGDRDEADDAGVLGNGTAAVSAEDIMAPPHLDCMKCEGSSSATLKVTPGSEDSDTLATVHTSVSACSKCQIPKPTPETATKLQHAPASKSGDANSSGSSGLVGTVKNWFTASDEQAASDVLDTSQVNHMDMGRAIQLVLRESGALQASHYQQWGAVHGASANKPPRHAQDEKDVSDIVDDTESSNKPHQRSATAGRNREEHTKNLPLFPNALTAPLPHAPSFKIYCMYGVGLPTERAYHYVQPADWSPDQLSQPLPVHIDDKQQQCPNAGLASGHEAAAAGQDSSKGTCYNPDASGKQDGQYAVTEHSKGQCGTEAGMEGDNSSKSASDADDKKQGAAAQQGKPRLNLEGTFDWKINTGLNHPDTDLISGIQLHTGDVTVPLLSLGAMCRGGWKSKRLNPAGVDVITREYQHVSVPLLKDPRGGPASGSHIDILGNEELLTDVLLVATGMEHEVPDRIITRVDEIAARIPWEDEDGWDWPELRPDHAKQS